MVKGLDTQSAIIVMSLCPVSNIVGILNHRYKKCLQSKFIRCRSLHMERITTITHNRVCQQGGNLELEIQSLHPMFVSN